MFSLCKVCIAHAFKRWKWFTKITTSTCTGIELPKKWPEQIEHIQSKNDWKMNSHLKSHRYFNNASFLMNEQNKWFDDHESNQWILRDFLKTTQQQKQLTVNLILGYYFILLLHCIVLHTCFFSSFLYLKQVFVILSSLELIYVKKCIYLWLPPLPISEVVEWVPMKLAIPKWFYQSLIVDYFFFLLFLMSLF